MIFFFSNLIFISLIFLVKSKIQDNYLLLVISLDGFRHDYLDIHSNKNGFLKKFSETGYRAGWSESIFPSNTYPNHWSIATGLYAESHGIINNHVYDPLLNQRFRMSKTSEDTPGWFQQAEPIWIKNQKVNKGKHSIVFDWPGSAAPFDNMQPYTFRQLTSNYSKMKTYNKTIDTFIDSLKVNETSLGFLYFNEPDKSGHAYGPESVEVEFVVKELDYILSYLFSSLKSRKNFDIEDNIDVLIVTDHGMALVRERVEDLENKFLYLSDYFDVNKILLYDKCNYGAFSELWFKETKDVKDIYEILKNNIKKKDFGKIKWIYLKKEIPERFHLMNSHRIAPLILVANIGYQIVLERNKNVSATKHRATHGFDPNDVQMRGTFLAKGKSFKKYYRSNKPVFLIDIYSLLCHLMDMKPNANNGSLSRISEVLVEFKSSENFKFNLFFYLFISMFFILFILRKNLRSIWLYMCNRFKRLCNFF
jgi:ectonucleotide pyrophosphatase/phosphodiesterase family protein 5